MTRTRKLIIAFWIFVISILLWQFYTYNEGMTREAVEHPKPEHYFFFHTNAVANPAAPAKTPSTGADVEQTSFGIQEGTPSKDFYTCSVTLKNKGKVKAVNVQVRVRPYKGSMVGNSDFGSVTPLDDNDALSQFGQWVTFSDLEPDASATQTVTFLNKPGANTGNNPAPEILFETEKPKQAASNHGAGN